MGKPLVRVNMSSFKSADVQIEREFYHPLAKYCTVVIMLLLLFFLPCCLLSFCFAKCEYTLRPKNTP